MSTTEAQAQVFRIREDTILSHKRFVVKHVLQIIRQDELIQGPLNDYPMKYLRAPPDCFDITTNNDTLLLEYPQKQKDSNGERKIDSSGKLQNGQKYLFSTFTLPGRGSTLFVLVQDLLKAINYQTSDEDHFLANHPQFLAIKCNDSDNKFLKEQLHISGEARFVAARTAFIMFGALVVASGTRLIDDYWETLGPMQGLTTHHRVYKLSNHLISKVELLKPSYFHKEEKSNISTMERTITFESPYPTITEQPSLEMREEFAKQFAQGQHITSLVPGQSISGSLELKAQFKQPRYHSKNSLLQAAQLKALNMPIGKHEELMNQPNTNMPNNTTMNAAMDNSSTSLASLAGSVDTPNNTYVGDAGDSVPSPGIVTKPFKRMLSNILDTSVSKVKKTEEMDALTNVTSGSSKTDSSLNLNGWKFESLPLKGRDNLSNKNESFSFKGLPYYDEAKLLERLKKLTPKEITELEHLHDSVYLDSGLQKMRKIRKQKWSKYWQYKAGIPIGLNSKQVEEFKGIYLRELLEQTDVTTTYNEVTNTDETQTITRSPNANYLGFTNIKGFSAPYAPIPIDKLREIQQQAQKQQKAINQK
ncbi:hypothetical protein KAFR_0C03700 [Kazachstania africana CBS 2517]|uniref:Uncharacterized protein n=1 Tax=Kazachstania africana (strain ATCC 22294 / BCRC 22015 / CBS 2517 / CECT 1963 / NBRC 1671 / NRRL Y-8276) TaxID=1071382 RepID=H2ASL2_KAZAF|nr:hypothetical protein KAFR_0C03700 [Kazachstania africana CBS 2517]CCF57362.1 hypothetical protein KAFR_0C03700 [Kazachstania africana CBS 2517]